MRATTPVQKSTIIIWSSPVHRPKGKSHGVCLLKRCCWQFCAALEPLPERWWYMPQANDAVKRQCTSYESKRHLVVRSLTMCWMPPLLHIRAAPSPCWVLARRLTAQRACSSRQVWDRMPGSGFKAGSPVPAPCSHWPSCQGLGPSCTTCVTVADQAASWAGEGGPVQEVAAGAAREGDRGLWALHLPAPVHRGRQAPEELRAVHAAPVSCGQY